MPLTNSHLCVSICETNWSSVARAISEAPAVAGAIEIRLDCLEPGALDDLAPLDQLLADCSQDTIITFRALEEGGFCEVDHETRWRFWNERGLKLKSTYVDLELDIVERLAREQIKVDWSRVICSYHNTVEVPAGLNQIVERLLATPAGILKVAVQVSDAVDCLQIFSLLADGRKTGREIIAIGMGNAGVTTRILGPAFGSFLTYASAVAGRATAAGQIDIEQLAGLYRLEKTSRDTAIHGLVGFPVSHSVSPEVHNAAFAKLGTDAVYIPFEVRDLKAFFKRMVHPRTRELDWRLRGLSITAPHKTAALAELDWLDPAASEIGAVNTVIIENERLCGYNTDAAAFIRPLTELLGPLNQLRVAVIGAGGAASAVLYGLKQANAHATIFARDLQRARTLADHWSVDAEDLNAGFADFDVVVNTTPLGARGGLENETPALAQQLRGARLAYDLVYNPVVTRFLREAKAAGCETLNGLPMFLQQAAAQFELWTGRAADAEVMRTAATSALNSTD